MSAHALAHHAPAAGGSFVARRRGARSPSRDRPTAAASLRDRRPAHRRSGSGVAGARGRDGLPGHRVRGPGRRRWRPRRQHEPDRLPGGLHRPLVRRPGRGHDLPPHRQLRSPRSTTTSRPTRGCARWSWPTRPRPCSTTPASSRRCCATTASRPSPASTPGRWPATCAPTAACAAIVTAPGVVDRADAVRPRREPFPAGRTRTSSARSRRRRSWTSAPR